MRGKESRFQEPLETIFFGGGTPSLLHPSEIETILELIQSQFQVQADAEISLETNPGTVDKEKLSAFRSAGINRLSIGIQSFLEDDLKFLTRIHSASEAIECVQDSYNAGFKNVSIDLIFSLPHQNLTRWKSNLEQVLQLQPQHISCYSLIIEPETPLSQMVQSHQVTPLPTESDAELYEFTIEHLNASGYEQYEVSNFSKPDYRCKHNLNYWNHSNYLGFGPSAHSFWKNERWWNFTDLATYNNQLGRGQLAQAGSEHLSSLQLMEETIFLGLRSNGINLTRFQQNFGFDFLGRYASLIAEFVRQEQAKISNNCFHLTSKGYVVCDEICQQFISSKEDEKS